MGYMYGGGRSWYLGMDGMGYMYAGGRSWYTRGWMVLAICMQEEEAGILEDGWYGLDVCRRKKLVYSRMDGMG